MRRDSDWQPELASTPQRDLVILVTSTVHNLRTLATTSDRDMRSLHISYH